MKIIKIINSKLFWICNFDHCQPEADPPLADNLLGICNFGFVIYML